MVKKILLTTLIVLLSGCLLGGWFWYVGGLEKKGREEAHCRKVDIIIVDSLESSVVDRQEMYRLVTKLVQGQRTDTVDLHAIEQAVRARGEVMGAEVYAADPRTISVKISQRRPVVRLENGTSRFYSDPEGFLFPVVHAVDVPVVTGRIPLSLDPHYKGMAPQECRAWVLGITELARYIDSRNTLRGQIEQIDVEADGDLVLYTAEEGPAVIFGDCGDYVEKFRKLEAWWRNIVPEAEREEKTYKTINLKYNHLIICKQK